MSTLARRLRSLLIALAVLAISATVALAGRSALSAPVQPAATQHEDGDEAGDQAETEQPEADAPEPTETEDATDSGDAVAAPTTHPDNHGAAVSEAAQSPTPDGFDNHGAYVRTIAQDNPGHAPDGAAAAAKTKHTKGGSH